MIRISKKADYAVFLMGRLVQSLDEGRPEAVVSAQELAEASPLGRPVVANLLKDLTRAGLLESVRGANGGYRLARNPAQISLRDILAAVEGPFLLVDCASDLASDVPAIDACTLTCLCHSRSPMRRVHERIDRMFAEIKLPELCGAAPTAGSVPSGTPRQPLP